MANAPRIHVRLWTDDKFASLSKPTPNAQTLWVYILTGPHQSQVPGLALFGPAAMAEALGWNPKDFGRCFQEILVLGLAKHDLKTRLLWVPKAHQYNPPQAPNVVLSWRYGFDSLPDCKLKSEAFETIKAFLTPYGKAFRIPFDMPLGKPFVKPKGKGSTLLSSSSLKTSFPEELRLNQDRESIALTAGVPKDWVLRIWNEWESAMKANGFRYADWDAAWRNNCHRAVTRADWNRLQNKTAAKFHTCSNPVKRDGKRFSQPCGNFVASGSLCDSCKEAMSSEKVTA